MVLDLLFKITVVDIVSDDYGRYAQMALKLEPDSAYYLFWNGVKIELLI